MSSKAFLFDLNGTMIDDMYFHQKAWFEVLINDLGANMTMEDTKKHMYGKNEELIYRIFGKDKFTSEEVNSYSIKKEKKYQELYLPHLKLIEGLDAFLERAKAHQIPLAIGTAASTFNVNYVLDHLPIKEYFKAIITADDVITGKPNPEVFLSCANALHVTSTDCIVFEDSPKGVEAAQNAGMKAIVIKTYHAEQEFYQFKNVLLFVSDFCDERLDFLFA